MRVVLSLLLVSVCAALPIRSVPLVLLAAERGDSTPSDGRIFRAASMAAIAATGVTADDLDELAEAIAATIPFSLALGGRSDVMLLDGRVLKSARIVAMGESRVTIDHAEGVTEEEVALVPPALLQRARQELAAAAAELKRIEAEAAARDQERLRESEARKAAELDERFALANARADATGSEPGGLSQRPATDLAQRLALLQQRFPPRKKGRNELGIEFDLPPRQLWTFYSSNFRAATIDELPGTLALLESRRTQDLAAWEWRASSTMSIPQSAEHVQAEQTVAWLAGTLRAFLSEARQLTRSR